MTPPAPAASARVVTSECCPWTQSMSSPDDAATGNGYTLRISRLTIDKQNSSPTRTTLTRARSSFILPMLRAMASRSMSGSRSAGISARPSRVRMMKMGAGDAG